MAESFIDDLEVEGPPEWTPSLTCIYGGYKWLNDRPLHYFNTNLTITFLHSHVRLMSEIVGVEKWSFEALFQRSVSHDRVDEILERYLRNTERFKFFPPVTLAILPAVDGDLQSDYKHRSFEVDGTSQKKHQLWSMPGVSIDFFVGSGGEIQNSGQVAFLRWQTSLFTAVALDGQHRIAALKKFRDAADPTAIRCDVPATILLFDPTLPPTKHLLNLVREIFVDVNNRAQAVDEHRLILLDDRDFPRRATRACVGQAFDNDGKIVMPAWKKIDPHIDLEILDAIPQELIDIRPGSKGASVQQLHTWQFLNLYNLYRIIRYFIFENDWERFEASLGVDGLTAADGELGATLEAKRQEWHDQGKRSVDETTFSFPPTVGGTLRDKHFEGKLKPLLMGVLTGVSAYKALLQAAEAGFRSANGGSLREFLIAQGDLSKSELAKGELSQLAKNWSDHKPELLATVRLLAKGIAKPADYEKDLIWYSVTQRALFWQWRHARTAIECFTPDHKTFRHFVMRYVDALNLLVDCGVFKLQYQCGGRYFWLGAPLQAENDGSLTVRPSDASAKKMGLRIRLLVGAVYAKASGKDCAQFISEADKKTSGLKNCLSAFRKGLKTALKNEDISLGKVKDDAEYKKLAQQGVKKSLDEAVFKCDKIPAPASPDGRTE